MARLVVLQGGVDSSGPQQLQLEKKEVVLGRQPDVDLRLDAREVSRRHARVLSPDGRLFFIEDLGSSNGTFLNSSRLQGKVELHEQDQIRIGPYLLRFEGAPSSEQDIVIRASLSAHTSNIDLFRQDPERKLQAVLELAHQMSRSLDLDELLPRLLQHLVNLFVQADRGIILMLEGDQPVVRCVHTKGTIRGEGPAFSRSVVRRVLEERIGLVAEDATADKRFEMMQTINRLGIRSFMCVPLKHLDDRPMGVLQIDRFGFGSPFTTEDLHLLTAISLQISTVLENVFLHEELLKKLRVEHELALARQIQEGYLPQDFTPLPHAPLELFGRVYPALEVSGDFYDFMAIDDRRVAFTVADVSGKGIPAALFMTGVRTLCRHLAVGAGSPSEVLQKLNDALAADNPTVMFVTTIFGIYDVVTGELQLANAGHPPPLLRRSDGHTEVLTTPPGRLLGFAAGKLPLTDTRAQLGPGDAILLHTDGVTEALGPDRQVMFGTERLLETFAALPATDPLEKWSDGIRGSVNLFAGKSAVTDDITLLLLRRPAS